MVHHRCVWLAGRQAGKQAGRQAGRQVSRQAGRQAGRQASRGDPKKLYLDPKIRVGGFLMHGATQETFRTEIQSNSFKRVA